jgi:hypothetical protein
MTDANKHTHEVRYTLRSHEKLSDLQGSDVIVSRRVVEENCLQGFGWYLKENDHLENLD